MLEVLHNNDCNAETQDNKGMTCLMEAARSGQQAMVEELCRRKVKQDTLDLHGNSALHHAVKYGHTEIAALCIEVSASSP